jgi:hypothetical protein
MIPSLKIEVRMKFDIIDALKQARYIVGHECDINCSLSDGAYLIQIKVFISGEVPLVYGQQFTFTDAEVIEDKWYIMNEKFRSALEALKLQIEHK